MPPKNTRSAAASTDAAATVKQTIGETLEAPRLSGIDTASFVAFKQLREIYERRVTEKGVEQGSSIPLTTYRSSIDDPILEIFITAEWVPVEKVSEISEDHLKRCIQQRALVQPEDFDLAQLEKGIRGVRMEKGKNLEMQIWKLVLMYRTTLDNLGYSNFIEKQPYLAVQHILKRISHDLLVSRMKLTYRLRKEEFKANFNLFVRELAKEAKAMDRHESATLLLRARLDYDSDTDKIMPSKSSKGNPRLRAIRTDDRKARTRRESEAGMRPTSSGAIGRASAKKRDAPSCLNPKCNGYHWMRDCPNTGDVEKVKLLDAYHANKKRDKGNIGQLSSPITEKNSSIFTATFCNGAVEAVALADQGSDINLIPPHVAVKIQKADASVNMEVLDGTFYYGTVDKSAPSLPCSRKMNATVTLLVRHAAKLIMRGMEWMVSDRPSKFVIIGRPVLQALGLDNRKLLAAACERFEGIVNVPDLLRPTLVPESNPSPQRQAQNNGTIQSLLRESHYEFGSTFHREGGTESDSLDDTGLYIDLGDDTDDVLNTALAARVRDAREQGMSDEGIDKLSELLEKYKQVFASGWAKPDQPTWSQ